ncbi:hypothetical protein E2R51_10915 [Jeotgalibacillus sp. S-D1]|uniref:DUF6612 family protein n=1 Tax=Jeotgalibacillus sp. S-D1 TaxID=2552189 RepID=UPI00105A6832|nr:DUF6612 family protein [Jeotgalibacillus sp. S-D1]TDL31733.1 hypothetical protein E2R51_10915 [Jeotgalibacillus sp. S-D1]
MKKLYSPLIFVSSFLFAGCSADPETPEEILEASIRALEDINSFQAKILIDQDIIYIDDNSSKQITEINADSVNDPEGIHATMVTNLIDLAPETVLEMYTDGETTYSTSKRWEEWYINQDGGTQPSLDSYKELLDLSERMEWLLSYAGEMDVKEKEDSLILSFTGSGEEFVPFTELMLDFSQPYFNLAEYLNDVSVNEIVYSISFDQNTLLPVDSTINLDIEMINGFDERDMLSDQTIEETYTKMDEIDPIKIPQEIIDNAKEAF